MPGSIEFEEKNDTTCNGEQDEFRLMKKYKKMYSLKEMAKMT